ncbi:MAG: hypothetical protein GQE15_19765 [Archangiaceae bacterium]|nr:hypothetical protein [Archangiaceae bacterium]
MTCAHCGSPVPLSSEAETACPACQTKLLVPERHREARRATEEVLANEVEARQWLERAGHEPPAILRVFTLLDGGLFWGLVFPAIFLPMGICLSTTLVPVLIRSIAHVRIVDVWADTTQGALSVGLPFLVLTLGLLISGFARKRVLAQAGLQGALAAKAPAKAAGVWSCRSCSAPLTMGAKAFSARCDYCDSDNLVRFSDRWLSQVQARRDRLIAVVTKASKDWKALRADLRMSLLLRTIFGAGLIALVTVPILSAKPSYASPSTFDVTKPPNEMPSWVEHRKSAPTSECTPTRITAWIQGKGPCDERGCHFFSLTSPLAGERVEVQGSTLARGTVVMLEPRIMRFLDSIWAPANEFTTTSDAQLVQFPVGGGGWYRLHLIVPDMQERQILRICVRQVMNSEVSK